MSRYVAVVLILVIFNCVRAPPPMRVTIDCPSNDRDSATVRYSGQKQKSNGEFDADSFCSLINSAIPKAVEDGRFVLLEDRDIDQEDYGNTLIPISKPPPNGFIPNFMKMRAPKLRIPTIKVPSLSFPDSLPRPPRVGSPMIFSARAPEESSAEKMEQFKKGVQKMLHVVKVLGKVDQYLSERTRIIIEKLSKTFAE